MGPSLLKHSICPEQGLVHSISASIGLGDLEPQDEHKCMPCNSDRRRIHPGRVLDPPMEGQKTCNPYPDGQYRIP
jgi:hypothetical protein